MQLENESGVILCFITEYTTTRHVLTVFEHGVCHAVFYSLLECNSQVLTIEMTGRKP